MRVAVMGSGGLGCFFGGLLARAGEDVTFIARGANFDAMRTKGLAVKLLPQGEFHLPVQAANHSAYVGAVDLVWCCVKTYDLESAARQLAPLIGPDTIILPIQNGVDAPDRIAAVVGPEYVIGGMCLGGATLEAPGVVSQKTARVEVLFGELGGGQSRRTEDLGDRLRKSGIDATVHTDIRTGIWEKFVGVCGTHALSALTRLPVAQLFAFAETRDLVRRVMKEVEAVARAAGVPLSEGCVDQVFRSYEARAIANPSVFASIYYDLERGTRLEIDDTNGAVVRIGHALGVPTPLNFAICASLKPYSGGRPHLPKASSPWSPVQES